jgi:hypothetical protein
MMDPEMLSLNGFATDPNWVVDAHQDYPRLAWEGTPGQPVPEPVIDWLGGNGTRKSPYELSSVDQLMRFSKAGVLADKHFRLINDLDLSGQTWPQVVIGYFNGTFDGNGYRIHHLHIQGADHLGLFGHTGEDAVITNLGLEAVDVNGTGERVGGLVGTNYGSITQSYSTGIVTGRSRVGGLVGTNEGDVTDCYSTGTVSGTGWSVGGLVGRSNGSISTSYSAGWVWGSNWGTGGLVGRNEGDVTDCHSTGTVSGDRYVGGLVGRGTGSITTSYSTGTVSGDSYVGGLVGSAGNIAASFWDIETSGLLGSAGGVGLTTAEMQTASTFLEAGWDFVGETTNGTEDIWWILEGQDYPRLIWNYKLPWAHSNDPPNGATDVLRSSILSWHPGIAAVEHDVYFGYDEEAVANATTEDPFIYKGRQTVQATSYDPGILELSTTYYWRIDEVNDADPNSPWKGSVWSFTVVDAISSPDPPDGASVVSHEPTLSWVPGAPGLQYDVYFGGNHDEVTNATPQSPDIYCGRQPPEMTTYQPGHLEWVKTYYWRVDGIDEADPNSPWKGDVWSFTVVDFIVVDDFESYNDIPEGELGSNLVYLTWQDGFDTPATNGSTIGYITGVSMETLTVHGGRQSVPYRYENKWKASEATRQFTSPRDWTRGGVARLSLWLYGDPANAPELMNVALNGAARVYHDNPGAARIGAWTEWIIDLNTFGVNLTDVNSMTIGFGVPGSTAAGGMGEVIFDDIRLYPPAPEPEP